MFRRKKQRKNALDLWIKNLKGLYGRGYLDFSDPSAVAEHLGELKNQRSSCTASANKLSRPVKSERPKENGAAAQGVGYVSMRDVPKLITSKETRAAIEKESKLTQPRRSSLFYVHTSEPVGRDTLATQTRNSTFSSRSSTVSSATGGYNEEGERSQYFAPLTKPDRVALPEILARVEKKEQDRKVGEALRKKFNLKCKSSVQSEWVSRESGTSGSRHYNGTGTQRSSVRELMAAITGVGNDYCFSDSLPNEKDRMYAEDEASSIYFDDNNSRSNKCCISHEDKNTPTSGYFRDFGFQRRTSFVQQSNDIYERRISFADSSSNVPADLNHNEDLKKGNLTSVEPMRNLSQSTSEPRWKTKRGSFFDDCWKDPSIFILAGNESPEMKSFCDESDNPFARASHEAENTLARAQFHDFGDQTVTPFVNQNDRIYNRSIFSAHRSSDVPSVVCHNEGLQEGKENITPVNPHRNVSPRISELRCKEKRGNFFDDSCSDDSSVIFQREATPERRPLYKYRQKLLASRVDEKRTREPSKVNSYLNDSGMNMDLNYSDESSHQGGIIPHGTFYTPPNLKCVGLSPDLFSNYREGNQYDETLKFSPGHDDDIFTQKSELEQDCSNIFGIKHNDRFVP